MLTVEDAQQRQTLTFQPGSGKPERSGKRERDIRGICEPCFEHSCCVSDRELSRWKRLGLLRYVVGVSF